MSIPVLRVKKKGFPSFGPFAFRCDVRMMDKLEIACLLSRLRTNGFATLLGRVGAPDPKNIKYLYHDEIRDHNHENPTFMMTWCDCDLTWESYGDNFLEDSPIVNARDLLEHLR